MSLSIIYAHYEGSAEFKANLMFFLKTGYIEDPNINYIFVINGQSTVIFPSKPNVTVVYRENKGYDFAGHGEGLKLLTRSYDYYLFINSTVRGPFLPMYTRGLINWWDPFISLLKSDPNIKLVGSTINIEPASCIIDRISPHVQSYIFMMDGECLSFLQSEQIFNQSYDKIIDVIVNQEIGMSEKILANGWNISCLVPEYQGKDYRSKDLSGKIVGNILSPVNPLGRIVHPYEVIFMKTNRDIGHQVISTLTTYYQHLHINTAKVIPAPISTLMSAPISPQTSPQTSVPTSVPTSTLTSAPTSAPTSAVKPETETDLELNELPTPKIKPIRSILKSNKRASSAIQPNYRVSARSNPFTGDLTVDQVVTESQRVSYNIKPPISQSNQNQNQIKPPLPINQNQPIAVKPPIYGNNPYLSQRVQIAIE
jgi:hypothetical protein